MITKKTWMGMLGFLLLGGAVHAGQAPKARPIALGTAAKQKVVYVAPGQKATIRMRSNNLFTTIGPRNIPLLYAQPSGRSYVIDLEPGDYLYVGERNRDLKFTVEAK